MRNSKKSNIIKLSKVQRESMIGEIQNYFYNEREEELGDLGASLILDFVIEKLGNEFYNQGVLDSYKYMNDHVEEMLGIQR